MQPDLSHYIIGVVIISFTSACLSYLITKAYMVARSQFENVKNQVITLTSRLENEKNNHQKTLEEQAVTKDLLKNALENKMTLELELTRTKSLYENIKKNYELERQESNAHQIKIDALRTNNQKIQNQLATAEANHVAIKESLEAQKSLTESNNKNAMMAFTNAADKILEEKSKRFTNTNKENIKQILEPLGERLKDFKQQVADTYDKESKQRFSLEDKIKELVGLNQQISREASNLTKALKGQSKTQGDWGEMILENILEYSGLVKGREYFTQDSYVDDEGNRKQPDIKIKYPDNRIVIIDSKVSLNAYERFINTEDKAEQVLYLSQHCKSIKNHIDNLSAKEYDRIDKALDFVMLFVPIEPAYIAAVQQDPDLWNYAYSKRVLLISPTNLIAALKMVSDIWKREHQNKNADEISRRGELLYDKFVNFVEDMENINKHLSQASGTYNKAMDKLSRGTGNLIGQAEKLKSLGLKPKKELGDRNKN